jgi:hypothetical protein
VEGNLRDCGGGDEDCGEVGGVKIPWAKVCMAKRNPKRSTPVDGWEKGPVLSGPKNRNENVAFCPMGEEKGPQVSSMKSQTEEASRGGRSSRG